MVWGVAKTKLWLYSQTDVLLIQLQTKKFQLHIYTSDELALRLKVHAVKKGKKVSAIASEALEQYLDQAEEIPVVTKPKKGVKAA